MCMSLANFHTRAILCFQLKLVIGSCDGWEAANDHIISQTMLKKAA